MTHLVVAVCTCGCLVVGNGGGSSLGVSLTDGVIVTASAIDIFRKLGKSGPKLGVRGRRGQVKGQGYQTRLYHKPRQTRTHTHTLDKISQATTFGSPVGQSRSWISQSILLPVSRQPPTEGSSNLGRAALSTCGNLESIVGLGPP